jgi:hypothetical protein
MFIPSSYDLTTMIKFNTQLGSEHLNFRAREQRDLLKPLLKGMHCRKCSIDSSINFYENQYGQVIPKINACCPEFHERIRKKIF